MSARIIYQPEGVAREYATLGANLFDGICPHRCRYCYSNAMWRRFHPDRADMPLLPKKNVIERLKRDAARLVRRHADTIEEVPPIHLTFLADPYPVNRPDLWKVTHEALKTLRKHGLHWQMLTKGAASAMTDFPLYRPGDSLGVTLTCVAEAYKWEPGAAPVEERLTVLGDAYKRGITTWVSAEPVINPDEICSLIRDIDYVDLWRVGKWSGQPRDVEIDWHEFGRNVADALSVSGAAYHIKEALQPYMPEGFPPMRRNTNA